MGPDDVRDRVTGSLLGLALGDALGAPFEFLRGHEIPSPLPALELPWSGGAAGTTTDDTAMARSLARSLAARGGFDPDDLMARHLAWFATGPPDVGSLTRRVLVRVGRGVPAEEASRSVWEERGPEVSAGNGSVMYCAPLGLAYASRPAALRDLAPRLSALTHHDERCRTAVLAVTLAVAGAAGGRSPGDALEEAVLASIDRPGGEELEFLVGAAGTGRPVDGPDMGFCLYAAAIGLQVLERAAGGRAGTFGEELSRVVALGGDTDTNAAVAGAVLGAVLGSGALPADWLGRLDGSDEMRDEAEALVPLALAVG
ncbi:MAG: ADP-ribosylglycohydrolase family protein [Actinobacteria bacterium]|nr:ADP-ribosylglycohydrolase family protein [Actinomycetota bacterium]